MAGRGRWVGVVLRDPYWPCREGEKHANADGGGTVVTAGVRTIVPMSRNTSTGERRRKPTALRTSICEGICERPFAERLPSRPASDRREGTAALIAGTVRCLAKQGRLAILRGVCLPGRGRGRVIVAPAQP